MSSALTIRETRSWHGRQWHESVMMLAFAMIATIRHQTNAMPPQKATRRKAGTIRWSIQETHYRYELAQRRIQPTHIIAKSLWRRAHQAAHNARN